jgi:hypothetical protein
VIRRSSPFVYSEAGVANDKEGLGGTMLFWSPLDNQIIVDCWGGSGKPKCGIYDVKADRISFVAGKHPAAFAGNPIRPDGKGFLVAKEGDMGVAGMSFIDRLGKEHVIALKPQALDSKEKRDILECPCLFTSFWDGNKAVVFDSKGRFEIDTDRYIGQFTSSAQARPKNDEEIMAQFAFPNSSKVVRVLEITKHNRVKFCRLEIFDTAEKKTKTLIERSIFFLFPSPNRKLVAVRCFEAETKEGKQSDLILVIDQKGEVVAKTAQEK